MQADRIKITRGFNRGGMFAAFMAFAVFLSGCTMLEKPDKPTVKTSTHRAEMGDLILGLSADGKVSLPVTSLNFPVSGTIKKIHVANGSDVKAGDVLAELDDTDLQLELTNAKNALEKANLAYSDVINQLDYNKKNEIVNLENLKKKLETPFDEYTYELSIKAAELTLKRRQTDYDDAVKELEETETKEVTAYDKYTQEQAVETAKLSVEKRKRELDEAQTALDKAKNAVIPQYDNASDLEKINSASLNSKRKNEDYENQLDTFYKTNYTTTKEYDDAMTRLKTAETARDDAAIAHTNAVAASERSKEQFNKTEREKYDNNLETAEKQYNNAKTAYDEALISLDTAKKNLDRGEKTYYESEEDKKETSIEANQSKVKTAKNALDDAQIALVNAENALVRARKEFEESLASTTAAYELQTIKTQNTINSETSIKTALLNIEDAKTKVSEAESNLSKSILAAPRDGRIINVNNKEGEVVTAKTSAPTINFGMGGNNSDFCTLLDTTEIYITANIPEGDIVGIKEGQQIRVTIDALEQENISAKVYSISSVPAMDSAGIVTYTVIGKMDELNPEIRDSMSVFLTFVKKEKYGVLLIPNKAVYVQDGQQYVNVGTEADKLEKRAVLCGLSDGTNTEVLEGLTAGETVFIGGVAK